MESNWDQMPRNTIENWLWLSIVKHFPYDYSRAIVHGEFYWDEKLPRLEDALKKAILRHGVPAQFYCNNGSVFSSHHLVRICAKLNIKLSHSRPYKPQGRGNVK